MSGRRGVRVMDLPRDPRPGVFLFCRQCGERYAAHAGDYFLARPDRVMRCCGRPLILAREERRIVEVSATEARS